MLLAREDSTVIEIVTTLKEWHQVLKSLYLERKTDLFITLADLISELVDLKHYLSNLLKESTLNETDATIVNSKHQSIYELKAKIVRKLDHGNKLLHLDVVPRDSNYNPIDPAKLSPINLHRLHLDATGCDTNLTSIFSSREVDFSTFSNKYSTIPPKNNFRKSHNPNEPATPSHIQVTILEHQLVSSGLDDLFELNFTILENVYNSVSSTINILSDNFIVRLKGDKVISRVSKTVFANVGSLSNREIFLYIQVYRIGSMILIDSGKATSRQLTNHQTINQDGSNQSLNNTSKYASNGLSKNLTQIYNSGQPPSYKRPFGAAMLNLSDISMQEDYSTTIKVMLCNEFEFSLYQELYLKKQQNLKTNPNVFIQLELMLKVFSCAERLIPRFSPSTAFCKTEKRGYPDVVMPGDFKNDLYFCLEYGEFEKGGKSIPKNIEASVSLINKAGIAIANCIHPGSNCDSFTCYKSSIFYHSNMPRWNEHIRINVPLSEFDSAHIRIEFRHCSTREKEKKFLGFAFLPLSDEDGALISNQQHELYLYKCDSQIWKEESLNLCCYTSSPYGPDCKIPFKSSNASLTNPFNHSNRESIIVSTFLLSTKLTQNRNLLNLLKWRELVKRNNNDFENALRNVLTLDGEEIVKFLQDILDTLFDTFTIYSVSDNDNKKNYSALIFKVLIHIFTLLDEPKYQHFQQVVDTYVSSHFSATLVYRGLLLCLKKCLDNALNIDNHIQIQRCFKSMKFIFQFVVKSRELFLKATGEQNDKLFINDLDHIFKLFEQTLTSVNRGLLPLQITILESFPSTYRHLVNVLTKQELVNVVNNLISALGNVPEELIKAKLVFMKQTASDEILKDQEARMMIIDIFCRHLEFHMKKPEELDLCQQILAEIIAQIHDFHWPALYGLFELTRANRLDTDVRCIMTVGGIKEYIETAIISRIGEAGHQTYINQFERIVNNMSGECEPVIQIVDLQVRLLESALKGLEVDKMLVECYCANLLTVLKIMSEKNYDKFILEGIDYYKLCDIFRAICEVFNQDWYIMQLTTIMILEHALGQLSRCLFKDILIEDQYINRKLRLYFELIMDFVIHPALQLENFSIKKRENILKIFGDVRLKFGSQLVETWKRLSPSTIYALLPALVQSIMGVALIPLEKFQTELIPAFYDMMDAEYRLKADFGQLSLCFVDKIELFMHLERRNSEFINSFKQILTDLIHKHQPVWRERGFQIINSMTKLMVYLLDYRQSLTSPDNFNWQMACLVNLLDFYKNEHDRPNLYAKYIFKLCQIHIDNCNHVEAGMTLKLYSDRLEWCNRSLPPLEDYRPEEPEWKRKEVIYHKIIDHFDKGKCWEEAIDLSKGLAAFYENWLVDFALLSDTFKKLAGFFDNILNQIRPEREYFRVEFLGRDLPEFVRDQEFVFRGKDYERLPEFMQRILDEFPGSVMLNPKTRQDVSKGSSGQYISVSNVKPKPCFNDNFKLSKTQSDKVIKYYLSNRVDVFAYDKPLNKEGASKSTDGDLKNRWVERTILKLSRQLPSILPWCKVYERETIEISPINHAIESISRMNLELSKLILSYKNDENDQISPLTMRLQGVIEAAVNGGSDLIIKSFLKPREKLIDTDDSFTDPPELVTKLHEVMQQQFSILETGLALHAKLAPLEVLPLQARLEEKLKATKELLPAKLEMIPKD